MYTRFAVTVILFGILATSCSCDNPAPPTTPPDKCSIPTDVIRIAVVTAASDFSAANLEIISTDDCTTCKNLFPGLHIDHSIRAHGNDVYILERFGKDNVVKYNANNMAIDYQQNLGVGINIQDIAVISETKAYISSYHNSDLIIFNPKTGSKISTVDLSRFNSYVNTDSAEAHPFVSALAVYDDYVYVVCQRLKTVQELLSSTFVPGDVSLIAIIDTRTDEIVGNITLNKKNPAAMDIYQGKMLVSSAGNWSDDTTSGVEMIDLATNQNLGIVAEGSDFGGSVSTVIFVSSNKAYVSKMSADFKTEIIPFNPTTGKIGTKVDGIENGFGGMVYDGFRVYVGERGFAAAGIAVINPETDTVERKIPTEMPPSAIAVVFAN